MLLSHDQKGNLCLESDVREVLNKNFVPVFTKEKEMEESVISMENINLQGHFEIREEELLGVLKSINVVKWQVIE